MSFVPLVRAFLSVLFRESRQRHLAMLWLVSSSPLAAAMLRDRLFGCCPRTAFDELVLLSAASVVVGVLGPAPLRWFGMALMAEWCFGTVQTARPVLVR